MRVVVSCTSCFKRFKFKFKRFTINTTPKTPVADWTLACIRMHLHYQLDGSSMTPRPPVLQGPKYYRSVMISAHSSAHRTKLLTPQMHIHAHTFACSSPVAALPWPIEGAVTSET
jgi:hypothetical protein